MPNLHILKFITLLTVTVSGTGLRDIEFTSRLRCGLIVKPPGTQESGLGRKGGGETVVLRVSRGFQRGDIPPL